MDESSLRAAREYALRGEGSGYITRHGNLVMAWGDPQIRYDLKSTTKSFGSIALGLAIKDGKIRLRDRAQLHHPTLGVPPEENLREGWLEEITILHLATQTAGFEKPGGYTRLLFRPGTQWDYSDSGPNWLAECITLAYRRDLQEWMFERVFTPLGIGRDDLRWRQNTYRPATIENVPRREFGSGISANVDAMARIGYLMLRQGRWVDQQILTPEYVALAAQTPAGHERLPVLDPKTYGHAARHYGLLWWNNADGTLAGVPRDAFWSWGLYDSLILVIPSLDVVVARAGKSWPRAEQANHYDVLKPFFGPIVESVRDAAKPSSTSAASDPSHPSSPVIRRIVWDAPETILRHAAGSDNWPATWADDDAIYLAYGDGNGFSPFVPQKLSLGLARVRGNPPDLAAENLRCPTLEQVGDGAAGKKASGLLMVDGVLYLLARNAGNSQLAWSHDHGSTWTWADWRWETSFGCPTFLNFGRDYDFARDNFVYVYSHDADSAYDRADAMVLARVPGRLIRQQAAYDFFAGLDPAGRPQWTSNLPDRAAVFTSPNRCYRSTVSYSAPLQRYLWVQTGLGKDTRFAGGLAIYDAAEPWGPWTVAFQTDAWDVGPGETASFPTKWISSDGQRMYLLFSGNDRLSVRGCSLELHDR
jgi:CubicO group peptidase (beta-lactamase class C family)